MKVLSDNKKAFFDYNIIEKFEAGMVLFGQEVKSIKTGRINLAGSFVTIKESEIFLVGVKVPPYQPRNAGADYAEDRARKLLLNRKEIDMLIGTAKQKGFSLIPLQIVEKNGRVKLTFGIAKGKKAFDKKAKIKKRDIDRETRRELSRE